MSLKWISAVSPRGNACHLGKESAAHTQQAERCRASGEKQRERQRACSWLARWSGFAGGQLSDVHSVRQHARPRPDQRGWSNEIVSRRGSLLARGNETLLLSASLVSAPIQLEQQFKSSRTLHSLLLFAEARRDAWWDLKRTGGETDCFCREEESFDSDL